EREVRNPSGVRAFVELPNVPENHEPGSRVDARDAVAEARADAAARTAGLHISALSGHGSIAPPRTGAGTLEGERSIMRNMLILLGAITLFACHGNKDSDEGS